MTTPAATVLIRCRNEVREIGPVLDAVLAQRDAPASEVVALDSGSTDGTLELLTRFPVRVERLRSEPFSYGRALNVGAEVARGDVVVYLSAHCRPCDDGWLASLLAPFADRDVVAAFGRQVPVPGVNAIEAITTRRNFPPTPPAGVLFSTANGAVRRAAVLARPFDEEIAIAEDHLWARGVAPPARIAYVPDAAVSHSHRMEYAHWRDRFFAHGLATAYARHRLGVTLPWGAGDDAVGHIVAGRAAAFARLAARLLGAGEARAVAALPSYALARTFAYAGGLREGSRRYGAAAP